MFLISAVLFICQALFICFIVKNSSKEKNRRSYNKIKSKIISKFTSLCLYKDEADYGCEMEKQDQASVKMIFIDLNDLVKQLKNYGLNTSIQASFDSSHKLKKELSLKSQFLNRFFSGMIKDSLVSSFKNKHDCIIARTEKDNKDDERRGVVPKSMNNQSSLILKRDLILRRIESILKRKIKRIVIVIVRKRGVRSLPVIYEIPDK